MTIWRRGQHVRYVGDSAGNNPYFEGQCGTIVDAHPSAYGGLHWSGRQLVILVRWDSPGLRPDGDDAYFARFFRLCTCRRKESRCVAGA